MNVGKFAIILIAGILQILIFYRFSVAIWQVQKKRYFIYSFIIISIVLNAFISVENITGVNFIGYLTGVLPFFLCVTLFESNSRNKLLVVVFNVSLENLCEVFAGMSTSLVFGKDVSKMHSSLIFYCVGLVVTVYLYYCITSFLVVLLHKGQKKLSLSFILAVLLTPLSFAIVCILLSRFMYQAHDIKYIVISLFAVMLLIVATIFIFLMVDRQTALELEAQKSSFLKIQLKTQKEHYEELYRSQKDTRKLFHDMKNSLIALTSMIEKEDSIQAEEYITSLTGKVDQLIHIVNTGIPALDGILQSKINYAKENDCSIGYKLLLPEKLLIDEIELAVLVGILLDNAIEASMKLSNKEQRKISLRMTTRFQYISIEIRNYVKEIVDVHNLETDKDDSLNHGLGLENARAIVKKYDGDLQLHCNGEIFVSQILLTNNCPK